MIIHALLLTAAITYAFIKKGIYESKVTLKPQYKRKVYWNLKYYPDVDTIINIVTTTLSSSNKKHKNK